MVGGLFLILSVFLLISKTIPVTKRRTLLVIFAAALTVSHYSLAYIYLAITAVIFIISRMKSRSDDSLDAVTVLLFSVVTFSWYVLTSWPLTSWSQNIASIFADLTTGLTPSAQTASAYFVTPQVFTASSWINLLLSGLENIFLIIGVLAITLKLNGKGISAQFKVILILSAVILAVSLITPSFASTIGFTRFYGITLLFLSPCFVFGGQTLLVAIRKAWRKIKRPLKTQITSKNNGIDRAILLIAIILGAFFLSQVGFVNHVTGGAIGSTIIDFDRIKTSSSYQVKISFNDAYISVQDVFSAVWLLNHENSSSTIFADAVSGANVLTSYGLIPRNLISPITDSTIPFPGSFVYLSGLNVEDIIITANGGFFNSSDFFLNLNECNLVYSNGNGEIWYSNFPG
jgi:uncharacterized membrane protein